MEPDPMGMALLLAMNNLLCLSIGALAAWLAFS